jgi:hypothetical protein
MENRYLKVLDVLSAAKLDHSNNGLIANAITDLIKPHSPFANKLINVFLESIKANKQTLITEATKQLGGTLSENVVDRADELL